VGNTYNTDREYRKNELLLLYDAQQSSRFAEEVLQRYRLTQKRSDELNSIRTKMLTVATNGQDPKALVATINKKEEKVEANLSSLFFTAAIANTNPSPVGYPLGLTGIAQAHQFTKGAGVKIGMVDTPIDILHRSLDNSKVRRVELIPAGDANNQKHGTAIAGVLIGQNPRIGIAPEASLYAVSAFSTDPKNPNDRSSTAGLVAKAIDLCIQENVDILNLSFAGKNDPLVQKMVQRAINNGIIVVSSVGNGGPTAEPAYPAAFEDVLAVTAVDEQESLFGRANRGSYIDLAAPGVNIFTTSPAGTFDLATGTSMATAHVTGLIALLLSMNKQGVTPKLLEQTAIDLGKQGRDNDYGYGLVNVDRALAALRAAANH
jgi:subtilisin family serine protease